MRDSPNNATRTARAQAALKTYCDYYGEVLDESSVQDLLTDLHHYLSSTGDKDPRQAMDEMLVMAGNHYNNEVREEVAP